MVENGRIRVKVFCKMMIKLQYFNERIIKSSRKSHAQDATNTKTPTAIIQHAYNHTHKQPLTHTYARTNFLTHIKLKDVKLLEKGTRETLK